MNVFMNTFKKYSYSYSNTLESIRIRIHWEVFTPCLVRNTWQQNKTEPIINRFLYLIILPGLLAISKLSALRVVASILGKLLSLWIQNAYLALFIVIRVHCVTSWPSLMRNRTPFHSNAGRRPLYLFCSRDMRRHAHGPQSV
jgi:hypothetical protein